MEIVKIRRVGNSNVVTLPRSLEAAGLTAGTSVVVGATPTGEVVLRAAGDLHQLFRQIGRKVIEEDREAIALLAAHDRGESIESNPEPEASTVCPKSRRSEQLSP